jgi:hypothetical protein
MIGRRDINEVRAEEIAKLFLLKSPLKLEIERSNRDLGWDFIVSIPRRPVKIGIEVRQTKNIKRDLERLAKLVQNQGRNHADLLPTILVVVDAKEVAGEVAILANWNNLGKLEIYTQPSFVAYSSESLDRLIDEVVRSYEMAHSLAS